MGKDEWVWPSLSLAEPDWEVAGNALKVILEWTKAVGL